MPPATHAMKAILSESSSVLRASLVLSAFALFLLGGCQTADPTTDLRVYPTPAEKNQQMQERMGEITRSLL
jgi:uncharacterized lipoprotein YajG